MPDALNVIQRFIAEYQTEGDETAAEELLAPDFVDHTPFPGFGSTREDVKRLFNALRTAFPDLRAEVHEQIADGDRVATHKTFHGTHKGPLFGIPPTGKPVAIRVIDLVRVCEGRIAEHWNVVDVAGLMSQMQTTTPVPETPAGQ